MGLINYNLNLSILEKKLLLILLLKGIKIDTLKGIERELENKYNIKYSYSTLIKLSRDYDILVASNYTDVSRNITNGIKIINGNVYNVFEVNKKEIIKLLKNSWEFYISQIIIKDEYEDVDMLEVLKEQLGLK